jgi:hypothetical protein
MHKAPEPGNPGALKPTTVTRRETWSTGLYAKVHLPRQVIIFGQGIVCTLLCAPENDDSRREELARVGSQTTTSEPRRDIRAWNAPGSRSRWPPVSGVNWNRGATG